ncbi:DUF4870 domain-containing protein [Vitiosangium sp. GDMCC 1.1324]|uniref:DUF4870 domain-containing protein n=1 Tax=Vitiosangium sp. (strain GDMCC 1.1324) TaxID=2138576 RepID=UPI000D37FA21|nr:DUF4870 domain-containing protein [Vitiosangium sp. GDMCC 1.1324]PTL75643.1 DUF4870 domain-containing protein [Vitiosangium sp. GDMCC 1.1324]
MELQQQAGFITGSPIPTAEEKQWGMLAHVLTLAPYFIAFPLIGFVGPMVVRATKGNESAWVDNHAKESLNFQITLLIGYAVSLGTVCLGVGFVLGIGVALYGLVMTIIAGIKAYNGEVYRYPVTLRLVK